MNAIIPPDAAKEFLRFQIHRKVINLYKGFLITLEDLPSLPPDQSQKLRKRVLDAGNDAIRELDEHLDKFKIELHL